jgi:NAD-dependent deacetylase
MKIVFFTGSGISQESGIPTFRDRVGLWENFDLERFASKSAWRINKEQMLNFHNQLRRTVLAVQPNEAHLFISQLQSQHDVTVITQNVDDLHERAGSRSVIHLHGNILESRSTINPKLIYECTKDLNLGDKCEKGSQLRPNVVWFGEDLDSSNIINSRQRLQEADLLVVIGTSLAVFPANTLIEFVTDDCNKILVDPNPVDKQVLNRFQLLQLSAVESVHKLKSVIN